MNSSPDLSGREVIKTFRKLGYTRGRPTGNYVPLIPPKGAVVEYILYEDHGLAKLKNRLDAPKIAAFRRLNNMITQSLPL